MAETTTFDMKKFKKYLGYKMYKELEDGSFNLIRIIRIKSSGIYIMNEDTKEEKKVSIDNLKGYTPLEPYGVISFSIIALNVPKEDDKSSTDTMNDVAIMLYKKLDLELGNYEPYAICRQSVNDLFADLGTDTGNSNQFGVCISRENCPGQVNFSILAACDEVIRSDVVNYYRDDNIDTIIKCIDTKIFDKVLQELHDKYCMANSPISLPSKYFRGWCTSVKMLLETNNFMADFNCLCNVTGIEFTLKDYMEEQSPLIYSLTKESILFFDLLYKINIKETRVIEYNYGIDLSEFNDKNYILIRDNTNALYLMVYTVDAEFFEDELEKKANELSISEKLKLSFYDKYSKK